ncbi:MAG: hypothetical protein P0S96_04150 [Simkaniaceae bacterium]|nr:hypothetical protein [Candidatus Sacchlamyda saccharinae]
MELIFQFTLLIVGLVLLWKMGDYAVRYALGVSKIFGIHQFTIGFIIFAVSTGFPEISAAVVSTLKNVPELSVGDLMGSTFVNISLMLGILALMRERIEISLSLRNKLFKVIALLALIFLWLTLFNQGSFWNGILLIIVYVASIFWFQGGLPKEEAGTEIKEIEQEVQEIEKAAWISPKIDILGRLLGSLGLLLIASWITVYAATNISTLMGVNLTYIGGTLIAVGTSFPELALAIHAVRRKEYGLALGDLFGSSLLNISFILGILMIMNPKIDLSFIWKLLPCLFAILIWTFQALFRKQELSRKDGYVFISIFIAYIVILYIK